MKGILQTETDNNSPEIGNTEFRPAKQEKTDSCAVAFTLKENNNTHVS